MPQQKNSEVATSPSTANDAVSRFDGQDWSALFLLLDAALDLPTAAEREALLARVPPLAPEYEATLRHLLDIHVRAELTEFLGYGPVQSGNR